MIHIRYKELSPGLHGKAERSGRGTTVYLLPGLTAGQRRAALRRLRQEASRGFGPQLRRPDLAVALTADRFRVGVRNAAAVVRLHPAGSLVPTALGGVLIALFVLTSASAGAVSLPQSPAGGLLAAGAARSFAGSPVLAHGNGNRAVGHSSGPHRPGCVQAGGRADDVTTGEDKTLRAGWRCWPLRRGVNTAAGQWRRWRPVFPDRRADIPGAVIPARSG